MNESEPDKPEAPDMPPSSEPTPPPTPPLSSPGEMLREAREARGFSQVELAEAAKLPQGTIVSLECDDFEVLKEPVYVRGYYRKCALTLEADVDAIVGAYERKAQPAAPALPDKIPLVAGGGSSILRRLLRALLLLLLLGLLLAAGWWLLQAPDADVAGNGLSPLQQRQADAPAADAQAAPADESAPRQDAVAVGEDAGPASGADGPGASQPVDAGRTDVVESAGEGAPELELRFRNESWLRLRDGADSTLRNELINAGSRQTITGDPPLELFLGYAPGVDVTWRGEPVDLTSATRGNNTALVTLE